MPTFNRARFIPGALHSLFQQEIQEWELVIVDDGSSDGTENTIKHFTNDIRVTFHRIDENRGLGAALNVGIGLSSAPLISYLPTDDILYRDHLASLLKCFEDPPVTVAFTGVRYGERDSVGAPDGHTLQLVQVMHRRTDERWTERDEMVTDDLDRMLWNRLRNNGITVTTGRVTCEWVQHPGQRHRTIRTEHDGGLNVYRDRYQVATPLRFRPSDDSPVDEVALYERFRRPRSTGNGMKILLVGELAFNPERIMAFEEQGHRLYGLWTPDGLGPNTVGPLPFGNVDDLPRSDWHREMERLEPDVIYALLNWRAVPFAFDVMRAARDTPFVWHFKESPMKCMRNGTWKALAALCTESNARVFCSELQRQWFETRLPDAMEASRTLVLDGDLPKREWLDGHRTPLLSERDGEPHVVLLGRPIGVDANSIAAITRLDVHVHMYGPRRPPHAPGNFTSWLGEMMRQGRGRVHVHPHVDQRSWVKELSQYDAGWMHDFVSSNGGEIERANWNDLNIPSRIPTLMFAGVPLLQRASPGSSVAVQNLILDRGVGVLYDSIDALEVTLRDRGAMTVVRERVWSLRHTFSFDHHVARLLALFRELAR
jgi:hypothetical protein